MPPLLTAPPGGDYDALAMARRRTSRSPGPPRRTSAISPLTVKRLSLYLRCLDNLAGQGMTTVSSRQLGETLGLTAAQVRKDLAQFGQFGRPGVGYHVADLTDKLRAIFGTDKLWNIALVGVGRLGRALLTYRGFRLKGFQLTAAFDNAPGKIGRKFGSVVVQPMSRLAQAVETDAIRLAVLAVPAQAAQDVARQLCRAGIRGILNFAPVNLRVPKAVTVIPVDLAAQIEQLSYFVSSANESNSRRPNRRR